MGTLYRTIKLGLLPYFFLTLITLTWFYTSLSQSRHPYHETFSVTYETFLVLKRVAIVPRRIIQTWD